MISYAIIGIMATSPERGSFTRNKEKISGLICFGPFEPHPIRSSPSGKASLAALEEYARPRKKDCNK